MDDSILKRPTYAWSIGALTASIAALALNFVVKSPWWAAASLAAAVFSGYIVYWSQIHRRTYLGQGIALLAFTLSVVQSFVLLGKITNAMVVRQTFQLSGALATFEDPVEKWSVSYPQHWIREEQRVSGTTNHVFKPSRVTPAMYFSVTSRPNIGTSDLSLVVDNFLMNLPQGNSAEILENETVELPGGQPARRLLYHDKSRRIPLTNEVLIVLDKSHLYFLNVGAAPRWFERQHAPLKELLFSLKTPA